MKQVIPKIKYASFGEEYEPDEESKKRRAWNYLFAVSAFNEIGAGADRNLNAARTITNAMRELCLDETGYDISEYEPQTVGSHYKGWKKNPYKKTVQGEP